MVQIDKVHTNISGTDFRDFLTLTDNGTVLSRFNASGQLYLGDASHNSANTLLTVFNGSGSEAYVKYQNTTTGSNTGDGTETGLTGAEFFFHNYELTGNITFRPGNTERLDLESDGTINMSAATMLDIPASASAAPAAEGEIIVDSDITDHTDLIKFFSGEEQVVISIPVGNLTANDGHGIFYNAANNEFEMAAGAGGSSEWTDTGSFLRPNDNNEGWLLYDADGDTLAASPSGFSNTNTSAAGTVLFQIKDGTDDMFAVDSTNRVIVGDRPSSFLTTTYLSLTRAGGS
jgi:hypothetical protein